MDFDRHLDELDFIPEYLEIEGSKNIEEIYKYVKLLGFSINDCKPWSTQKLAKYYSK